MSPSWIEPKTMSVVWEMHVIRLGRRFRPFASSEALRMSRVARALMPLIRVSARMMSKM